MGEIYIGCGFIRGKLAGIYYGILGRVCDRLAGGEGPFRYQNLYAYPAGDSLWSPKGVAESPEGDGLYGSPPGPYFSMKKSRQKSFRAPP